tara:strand:+ start:873 stop:1928 length:1056 start_codon:yes stop_codon:yes gene_type:complete
MIQADPLIMATLDKLLADQCSNDVVNAADNGQWPETLWQSLEATGLSRAWISEAAGGGGASLADGFAIARLSGHHATPVPLTETLLASYLLAAAGLDVPAGPMTVAPVYGDATLPAVANGRFSGNVQRLPFAHSAQHAVCTVTLESGVGLALFDRNAWRVGEVAGAARGIDADVTFAGAPVAIATEGDWGDALLLMGAALRSQQMAGALAYILAQSSDYAQTRTQFGRAIVKFQAVQHNLAILAGEVAAASAAADAAMKTIIQYGLTDPRTFMAVASAKIRAGEAANAGAAIAHQVHGAIGFTREYSLHHRTRRLWTWRDDFLPERVWAARLGQFVCDQGADDLWPTLTSI